MKTKQERIEEMGKVIPEKIKDPLDNSRYIIFGKSLRREIARIYYNAGYRKEDEVRKETAEKFYDKVNENICVFQLENKNQEFTDGYAQAIADICGRLDQVAKQFGVEIEE